jgi:hypothetical protein
LFLVISEFDVCCEELTVGSIVVFDATLGASINSLTCHLCLGRVRGPSGTTLGV